MEPTTPKPAPCPIDADAVPASMKTTPRWLNWRWEWKGKKWDKPPYRANGRLGSSTDPAAWCPFQEALAGVSAGLFDGVGFALGEDAATGKVWSGFDLDDCVEGGQVEPAAAYLLSCLDSYTEFSPSGNGLKVFLAGRFPPRHLCADHQRRFELYDGGRYFTVTGRRLDGSPAEVLERGDRMATLYAQLFPPQEDDRGPALSDREKAVFALKALAKDLAVGYNDWLRVGMALHSTSTDLLDEWDSWSRAAAPEKWKDGACARKWASFKKSGVGLGSLVQWAKQTGWTPPWAAAAGGHLRPGTNGVALPARRATALNLSTDDPHMGDGLTEEDGAGPWELRIEDSDPPRYWLKAPPWADSPRLPEGFILLSKLQLFSWTLIRREAVDQAGVYVGPDAHKKPVWDGRKGPRLLRRLLEAVEHTPSPLDYDRVLSAAEFILDCGRRSAVHVPERHGENGSDLRGIYRTEDGSIVFKLRYLFTLAKKDSPSTSYEDLREAAARYASPYWPPGPGKRNRFHRVTHQQISALEAKINRHAPSQ